MYPQLYKGSRDVHTCLGYIGCSSSVGLRVQYVWFGGISGLRIAVQDSGFIGLELLGPCRAYSGKLLSYSLAPYLDPGFVR